MGRSRRSITSGLVAAAKATPLPSSPRCSSERWSRSRHRSRHRSQSRSRTRTQSRSRSRRAHAAADGDPSPSQPQTSSPPPPPPPLSQKSALAPSARARARACASISPDALTICLDQQRIKGEDDGLARQKHRNASACTSTCTSSTAVNSENTPPSGKVDGGTTTPSGNPPLGQPGLHNYRHPHQHRQHHHPPPLPHNKYASSSSRLVSQSTTRSHLSSIVAGDDGDEDDGILTRFAYQTQNQATRGVPQRRVTPRPLLASSPPPRASSSLAPDRNDLLDSQSQAQVARLHAGHFDFVLSFPATAAARRRDFACNLVALRPRVPCLSSTCPRYGSSMLTLVATPLPFPAGVVSPPSLVSSTSPPSAAPAMLTPPPSSSPPPAAVGSAAEPYQLPASPPSAYGSSVGLTSVSPSTTFLGSGRSVSGSGSVNTLDSHPLQPLLPHLPTNFSRRIEDSVEAIDQEEEDLLETVHAVKLVERAGATGRTLPLPLPLPLSVSLPLPPLVLSDQERPPPLLRSYPLPLPPAHQPHALPKKISPRRPSPKQLDHVRVRAAPTTTTILTTINTNTTRRTPPSARKAAAMPLVARNHPYPLAAARPTSAVVQAPTTPTSHLPVKRQSGMTTRGGAPKSHTPSQVQAQANSQAEAEAQRLKVDLRAPSSDQRKEETAEVGQEGQDTTHKAQSEEVWHLLPADEKTDISDKAEDGTARTSKTPTIPSRIGRYANVQLPKMLAQSSRPLAEPQIDLTREGMALDLAMHRDTRLTSPAVTQKRQRQRQQPTVADGKDRDKTNQPLDSTPTPIRTRTPGTVTTRIPAATVVAPRPRSIKPLTRPVFGLPGEAISKRKQAEKHDRVIAQEEEARRKREFKACPSRPALVLTTANVSPLRGAIASHARSLDPLLPSQSQSQSPSQSPSHAQSHAQSPSQSHSQSRVPLLPTALAQNRSVAPPCPPPNSLSSRSLSPTSPDVASADCHSVAPAAMLDCIAMMGNLELNLPTNPNLNSAGSRMSVSAQEFHEQRRRGKEIYNRDAAFQRDLQRDRRLREDMNRRAREEAARLSRQRSRIWAEKNRLHP